MFKKRSVSSVALEYILAAVLCAVCRFFMLNTGSAGLHTVALGFGLLVLYVAAFRKVSLGLAAALAAGTAMIVYALIAEEPRLLLYSFVYLGADLLVPVLLRIFKGYSRYLTVIWAGMARFLFMWILAALVYGSAIINGPAIVGWRELVLSILAGFLGALVSFRLDKRIVSE